MSHGYILTSYPVLEPAPRGWHPFIHDAGQGLGLEDGRGVRVAARRVRRVIVATDHEEIVRAAEGFGAEAILTSREHRSGTDRVAEVVERPFIQHL